MTKRLRVRADKRALAVGRSWVDGRGRHEVLGAAQAWPGQAGEQVVLDLVVEATEHEVHRPATAYVARRQHLAPEKVQLVLLGEHRHPLVVGCKGTPQVQAEQALLHDDEDRRPQWGE